MFTAATNLAAAVFLFDVPIKWIEKVAPNNCDMICGVKRRKRGAFIPAFSLVTAVQIFTADFYKTREKKCFDFLIFCVKLTS